MSARFLHRMGLASEPPPAPVPDGVVIRRYAPERDHARIPALFAAAFGAPPWPDDWDAFGEFDPRGVFLAEALATGEAIGFVTCFRRAGFGYVSVLGVVPGWRRRGVAGALLRSAVGHLRSLGLTAVEVDAFTDAGPAVGLYRDFGFEVLRTYEDPEARSDGAAAAPALDGAAPDGARVA